MQSITGISSGSLDGGSSDSVLRAAQVLLSRLGHDLDAIREVVDAGPLVFQRVARAQLRGFGLSTADLDRVRQLVRQHLTSHR